MALSLLLPLVLLFSLLSTVPAMETTIDLTDPSAALDLANIRFHLIRLEDTIIFHLIERVQFPLNPTIYKPHGGVNIPNFDGSFLDWMLQQQENIHAQVRRYEAPDEFPFFPETLPKPFLSPLTYPEVLHPNTVNLNAKIKDSYIHHILPAACVDSTDHGESHENYGSSAVNDVACLQALSRRIHFGKFVAESKFRSNQEEFTRMIKEKDIPGLTKAITDTNVEQQVLKRLELKARTYGTDPSEVAQGKQAESKINIEGVVAIYRDYVIPQTKEVEIEYLLQRLDPAPPRADEKIRA